MGLGDVDGDGTPDLAVTSKWVHEGACGARGMVAGVHGSFGLGKIGRFLRVGKLEKSSQRIR